MSNKKVVCNKCGYTNILIDDNKLECANCHELIDVKTSIIKNVDTKTQDRLIYEIENKVIRDENCKELLRQIILDNDLTKYLNQKYNKVIDLNWLNKESKYYDLIIKDVMRSESFDNNDRIQIINTISDNELLLNMLDESIYKTEDSKQMVNSLAKEPIKVVKNAPSKPNDLFIIKLLIGFVTMILILFMGLMMDKELARPTVILLSILPACIFGFTIANKLFKKLYTRILMCFVFTLIAFFVVSYMESIVYIGFVGIVDHAKNIINALPDFVDELFKRIDVFEEIKEPEPTNTPQGGGE